MAVPGKEEPAAHVKEAPNMSQDVEFEAEEPGISGLPRKATTQHNLVPAEPAIEGDDTGAQEPEHQQDDEMRSSKEGASDTDQCLFARTRKRTGKARTSRDAALNRWSNWH